MHQKAVRVVHVIADSTTVEEVKISNPDMTGSLVSTFRDRRG
jgi:hypothetical protein